MAADTRITLSDILSDDHDAKHEIKGISRLPKYRDTVTELAAVLSSFNFYF